MPRTMAQLSVAKIAPCGLRPLACLWILLLAFGGFNVLLPTTEALTSSRVMQCVRKEDGSSEGETCIPRSHTDVDVYGGMRSFDYLLRDADNPNKGVYIHIRTSVTSILYPLKYIVDVPLYYKEHNDSRTYGEMNGNCSNCNYLYHAKCSSEEDLPPYLREQFKDQVCCSCFNNVSDSSPRAEFSCRGIAAALLWGICVNMSCLEVVGPWYSIFKPKYPPDLHRRTFIDVFQFDGDKGIIPDVAKKGLDNLDDTDEDLLFFEQPVYSNGHFKATLTNDRTSVKSDDLDLTIKIIKGSFIDGNAPLKVDDYIAIPTWPSTDPTVQGSSLEFDCIDPTWPKDSYTIDAEMVLREERTERCARNVRAIEMDALDTTGVTCDKIGVSMSTWANDSRLCNSEKGSCVQNQLGWYLDAKGDKAKLPRLYNAPPLLMRKQLQPEDESEEGTIWRHGDFVHALAYSAVGVDTWRIEINSFVSTVTEIISESAGFIVGANIIGTCAVSSGKPCYVKVITKNVSNIRASYTHRVHCYEEGAKDVTVASTTEAIVDIDPNKTATTELTLKIINLEVTKPLFCDVALLSALEDSLGSVTIPLVVEAPTPTLGLDTRSFDDKTKPEDEKKTVLPGVPNMGGAQCNCSGLALLCFMSNFSPCMQYFFDSYYGWVVGSVLTLLLIILLPIIIPLLRCLFGRIGAGINELRFSQTRRHAAPGPSDATEINRV